MATSNTKKLHANLRTNFLTQIQEYFEAHDEEVLVTGTNKIAIPCVDEEGNDEFVEITVKVPTGSRDGDPYDGYSEADAFAMLQRENAEKKAKKAKEKAEKIAKDKADREAKARAKAEHNAKKEG